MIDEGAYGHSPPEFRALPEFVGTGENILMGYRGAQDAHVGWMRSDGHRTNILNVDYDAVGIGVVCRNDGSMWATQISVNTSRQPSRRGFDFLTSRVVEDLPVPEWLLERHARERCAVGE